MLRLEQAQKEAVILACTMTDEAQATLFEIDVASNFVLTPVKDPLFPKSPIFLKTVSYCEDEAEPWRRQIKVWLCLHLCRRDLGVIEYLDDTFESCFQSS